MRINQMDIHVEEHGNPKGDKIVFLNGVMASVNSWYILMKPFVEMGFHVILHDFKGQLRSDKPKGPYTFAEHAAETIMVLEKLGVKKAHFIGTSYGGEVGMNIAFRYPEVVKSLVVIDSVSEIDDAMETEINRWIELCEKKDGYQFFWGMADIIYGSRFLAENKAFLEERAKATAHVDPSYFEGQIALYQTFNQDIQMTDRLKEINAPVLVVCGEDDKLKPRRFSKIIHDEIAQSEYVIIPECGHVTIFEKPKELSTLLIGFVQKHC
ncbi:MAG: alpha/beta hydrolase [Acholeplasmataceae bacterium]|nr:MAG: alpha/beta hydrolase [Acholeplasmataceae bacterium]